MWAKYLDYIKLMYQQNSPPNPPVRYDNHVNCCFWAESAPLMNYDIGFASVKLKALVGHLTQLT